MIDRGDFVPRAAKLLDVARDSGSFVPSRSWSSQCASCPFPLVMVVSAGEGAPSLSVHVNSQKGLHPEATNTSPSPRTFLPSSIFSQASFGVLRSPRLFLSSPYSLHIFFE